MKKEDVFTEVKRLDPNINEEDESFKIASFLIASLEYGADENKIAAFLGYPLADCYKWAAKCRENDIWTQSDKIKADWFDKKHGGIDFWLSVLAVQGMVKRC